MSDIVSLNGYKIKDEKAVRSYDTIALMKADTKLKEGYHVKTKGYYEANDGGHGEYVIVDDETLVGDDGFIHVLTNGLRAKLLINEDFIIDCIGAKGDGDTDDSNYFQTALTKVKKINGNPLKTYKADINISSSNITLNGINLKGTITFNENLRFINITNCDIDASGKNYGIYADYNVVKLVIENCFIHNATNTGLYLNNSWDYQINKVSVSSNAIMGVYLNKFNSSVFNGTCYDNGIGMSINNSYSSNVRGTIQENKQTGIDIEGVVGCKFHLYLEQNGYEGTDDVTTSQCYIGSYQHVCLSNEFNIYANGGINSEMSSAIGIYALYCENSKFTGYLVGHTTTGIHISSHAIQNIVDLIDLNHVDYGYDNLLQKHTYKKVIQSNTVFDLNSNEECIPVINGDTPYLIAFVRRSSTQALIRVKDIEGINQAVECNCYILTNGIKTSL